MWITGKTNIFLILLAGWIGALLMLPCALGQITTGQIAGTVTDTSGAVIPNAKITLTNGATGVSQSTTSGATGAYLFPAVNPGIYNMNVTAPGFQQSVTVGIRAHIQTTLTVNVKLRVGVVAQKVTVTAAPPLLQAQNASIGQTIDERQVNNMPLQTRDWTTLTNLAAGVSSNKGPGNSQANVDGQNFTQNDYRLNGVDDNAEVNSNGHITGPGRSSTNPGNGYAVIVPPPDAIQEFKLQSGDFSAEFGHSTGGVVNAVLKSGTNHLNGDLWEYVRNTVFNANDYFAKQQGIARSPYHQNQFGGTIGGPVMIPKIYDGRNRTFFFFSYQGTRVTKPLSSSSDVPTAAMRSSDFTDFRDLFKYVGGTKTDALGRVFPQATIFDPATTRLVAANSVDPVTGLLNPSSSAVYVRDPFYTGGSLVGIKNFTGLSQDLNQLPVSRVDPNAQKLLALYPAPTSQAQQFPNYFQFAPEPNNVNQYDLRIDEHVSDKDYFFGTYDYSAEHVHQPTPLPGIADGQAYAAGPGDSLRYLIALGYTHVFTPTLTNEAHVGWNHEIERLIGQFGNTLGIPEQFGIAGVPQIPTAGGLPAINLGNFTGIGTACCMPTLYTETALEFMDNVTKVDGANSIKAGFQLDDIRSPIIQPGQAQGFLDYSGQYTDIPNQNTGFGGAAQMLLAPTASSVPGGLNNVGGTDSYLITNFEQTKDQRYYMGAYVQDNWRVLPTLTLNLGVRWDYTTPYQEVHGHQANFIQTGGGAGDSGTFFMPQSTCDTPVSPAFVSLLASYNIKKVCTSNKSTGNGQIDNFAPRIGFAYSVTPRMVVRGGYGITYGILNNNGYGEQLGNNYPFQYTVQFNAVDSQTPLTIPSGATATLENAFTSVNLQNAVSVNPVGLTLVGRKYNYNTSYQQTVNFTVQDQFTNHDTVSAGYVGVFGRHLDAFGSQNAPSAIMPPGTNQFDPSVEGHIPFPLFAPNSPFEIPEATSSYNALQVVYQRELNAGLFVLANYTFSKCMTDNQNDSGGANGNLGYRAEWLPGFGPQGDYAVCNTNVAQVVHVSGTYDLPFGRSQRFLGKANGLTNAFVGGWMATFIYTHQTGLPIAIPCPVATTADFGCSADVVPGAHMYAGPHNATQWMNPAAFVNPPVATSVGQGDYSPLGGSPYQAVGPGWFDLDMSLLKQIPITEKYRLQFRAEAFNLPNSHGWANPGNLNFQNPVNFGAISSSINNPRVLQLALKLFY